MIFKITVFDYCREFGQAHVTLACGTSEGELLCNKCGLNAVSSLIMEILSTIMLIVIVITVL